MSTVTPLVSVVTPTYQRVDMLRRAIESVRAQSYANWELIVSDDEDPPAAAWAMLQDLADRDPRIRAVRNPGPHGQSGNVNFAMRHARGEWIKPLYDDDVLVPECLSTFAATVAARPSVALATCFVDRYRHGRLVRSERRGARAAVELIERANARLAMYLQDVDIGIPTQVMVRRDVVVERGVWFEPLPGIGTAVDSWWYFRVLAHGDLLMINRPLVQEHQGEHVTVTSQTTEPTHDREVELLRQHMWPALDPALHAPPLPVVRQMLCMIRALHRLSNRRPLDALKLAGKAWHPRAWQLAMSWLLRRRYPGRFYAVPRQTIEP